MQCHVCTVQAPHQFCTERAGFSNPTCTSQEHTHTHTHTQARACGLRTHSEFTLEKVTAHAHSLHRAMPPVPSGRQRCKPGCCSSGVKSPSPKWLVCLSLAFSVSVAAVKKPIHSNVCSAWSLHFSGYFPRSWLQRRISQHSGFYFHGRRFHCCLMCCPRRAQRFFMIVETSPQSGRILIVAVLVSDERLRLAS